MAKVLGCFDPAVKELYGWIKKHGFIKDEALVAGFSIHATRAGGYVVIDVKLIAQKEDGE